MAQIRSCNIEGFPAFVRRRGDSKSGSVIFVIDNLKGGVKVFSLAHDVNGGLIWVEAHGAELFNNTEAESYIMRQATIDPDAWVIEVEDSKEKFVLMEPHLDAQT